MTNLNVAAVKEIANENETSRSIFNELGTRQRSRARINLRKFKYDLLTTGQPIVDEQFVETFKKLQDLGVGKIISGRLGNATRFVWNYKLRDVASAVHSKETPIVTKKKLTSPASEPKKELAVGGQIQITFSISANTRTEDLAALISLAKELK